MPISEDAQLLVVGLAALALLALALGALFVLRGRQRLLVAESRARLLAIMALPGPLEERLSRIQAFTAALRCDKVRAHRPRHPGEPVQEESEAREPEPVEEGAGTRPYSEVGDRVAAVLEAAELAAAQIREDAQTAAEQLTRQAESEAKSRLADAKKEADRVRAEADRESKNTKDAVELYATNHRREAEEQASRLLSEAETQARASREAAEAMAERIQEDARTLEEEVREQERVIRGRLQRYLAALRDVAGQIEDAIGEPARAEQTLVAALDVERSKEEE